jgi:hypothetical protein
VSVSKLPAFTLTNLSLSFPERVFHPEVVNICEVFSELEVLRLHSREYKKLEKILLMSFRTPKLKILELSGVPQLIAANLLFKFHQKNHLDGSLTTKGNSDPLYRFLVSKNDFL